MACKGKSQQETQKEKETVPVFETVTVPNVITDPQDRADYIIDRYWNKFDFTDTTYIHFPAVTEQAFSNYLMFLSHATPEKSISSIRSMLQKAETDSLMFAYFTDLYERYLYDPNSPMRNEEFFIPVLETILASPTVSEVNKIRPAHLLEIARKNRVGEKAIDFTYALADGKTGTLYNLRSEYLILYFFNPDCEACRVMTHQLANSPVINELIKNKHLKILAVYPDESPDEWKNHITQLPKIWINSYDPAIALKNDELYDLRAIPNLYLLDKNKVVVLKDAPFERVEAYLYNNSSI